MLTLKPNERSILRAQAHALEPTVLIGEAGLTEAVIKEIEVHLNAHALIKVRVFGDDREKRVAFYETICNRLNALPIQHIGKLLVIYRPKKEPEQVAHKHRTSGKALKTVTVAKRSRSGHKKPTISKIALKGNERITAGGNVKRAKTRQVSTKKRSLEK